MAEFQDRTATAVACHRERVNRSGTGGTTAAAPPPSGLATLPSVGAVP